LIASLGRYVRRITQHQPTVGPRAPERDRFGGFAGPPRSSRRPATPAPAAPACNRCDVW